jgi:hypothetical protein
MAARRRGPTVARCGVIAPYRTAEGVGTLKEEGAVTPHGAGIPDDGSAPDIIERLKMKGLVMVVPVARIR